MIPDISIRRVVVINTAFLGDLVLTIPFLTRLKLKYPQAKISLVCKKGIGDLFLKLNLVDEILDVQKGAGSAYSTVAERLNKEAIDFVFCIHRSLRSYLFSLKLNATYRVGYKLGFNFLGYHARVPRDLTLPEPLRILQLLSLVDAAFAAHFAIESKSSNFNSKNDEQKMVAVPEWASFPRVSLPALPSEISGGNHLDILERLTGAVAETKKYIAVFPGSVWNTKRWPVEYFAELVKKLIEQNHRVVLMGGLGEEVYGDVIERTVGASKALVNIVAKTSVWESMLVLNQCDLVVVNDSASGHLAALLDKKILTFFGPTVLSFGYRPWGNSVTVMENTKITCRPCGAHGPQVCPIKTHICMTSISPEAAMKQIELIL